MKRSRFTEEQIIDPCLEALSQLASSSNLKCFSGGRMTARSEQFADKQVSPVPDSGTTQDALHPSSERE